MSLYPTVQRWHDKVAFVQAHFERWLENEAENIVFLRSKPHSMAGDVQCLSVHDVLGDVVQTAVFTPHDQIILSGGTAQSVHALCRYLADQNLVIPGIFAPFPASRQTAANLESLTGQQFQVAKELLHLALQQPPKSHQTAGTCRLAQSQDVEPLTLHRNAIQEESNTQRPFDAAQSIRADLQEGGLYKWVDDSGRIVGSGTIYYERLPTSAYINHVYVEPAYRRRGYASALVSTLCEQALARGRVPRLSVDAVNQPAYQAYLKLGFVLEARMDNLRAIR